MEKNSDIMFESIYSGKVCYLSDNKVNRINHVLKPLEESDEYYQTTVDDIKLSELAEMMEENPVLFYDTTELEGPDGGETQKTLDKWLEEL